MMDRLRVVLFGDGAWAARSLERLVREGVDVAGVVERAHPSDAMLGDVADALGIPVLRPRDAHASAFVREIAGLAPDLALSISYNQILRRPLLDVPPLGFVNVHAGMLPRYRGRNVINWAILNGEREIGLTAHQVDDGIDTGDILVQRSLPIGWTDTYGDVLARVIDAIPDLVMDTVMRIARGAARPRPQMEAGTYFGGREEGDEWLDWSDTSRHLHNMIRAISRPGPGARTMLGQHEVIIWRAYYDPSWPSYRATPGQVVGRQTDGSAVVKSGDSTIVVHEVQQEDGVCGTPCWRIGTRLGVNLAASLRSVMARMSALEVERTRAGSAIS
ncbi:MAG TPA: methionyl-tRNA formyltransferase [Gemmatimonadaceae bacterium]|nr:methionyl-tRNA formyltransferase [Gemmatimonadaceae bacterium]